MLAHDSQGAVGTVETAPAKINLALHVVGQRADGYHLLETLVTFTEAGDVVRIRDADEDGFTLSGQFAHALCNTDPSGNLVLKARDLLRRHAAQMGSATPPVGIHLDKNLPVASGIGGGSADAAAALRGLIRHWRLSIDAGALNGIALTLGADVPMCLASRPLIARGIGEEIGPLVPFPQLHLVLVNPLKAVSTPQIFRLLESKTNEALPERIEAKAQDWVSILAGLRNDLQAPAVKVLPQIDDILVMLRGQGAELVRMSGSGATCFGLFAASGTAQAAATTLREQQPGWYVQATTTIGGLAP